MWATDTRLHDFDALRGLTAGAPLAVLIGASVLLYAAAVHLLGGAEPREFLAMMRRRRR